MQTQYMTRKRHPDLEQLDYPDYWDECVGRINTGRILTSLYPPVFLEGFEEIKIKEESNIEPNIEPHKEVPTEEQKKRYNILVEHHYGSQEIAIDNELDYNLSSYKEELDQYFWRGFTKTVSLVECSE